MSTKISVIVPVLNSVNTIRNTIESIIKNDDDSLELLIIDGGSTDGTLDIVREYGPYIDYIQSGDDDGISDAFNRGIANSTGEIVGILNSDDTWLDTTVETIKLVVSKFPDDDIYYGRIKYFDINNKRYYEKTPRLANMKYRMSIFHPSMFVRKEAYLKIGCYSTEYGFAMDSEWCHRAIANRLKFRFIDSVLSVMSLGGNSDANFGRSLIEYRQSSLKHSIGHPFVVNLSFVVFYCLKWLTKYRYIRLIKQIILDK